MRLVLSALLLSSIALLSACSSEQPASDEAQQAASAASGAETVPEASQSEIDTGGEATEDDIAAAGEGATPMDQRVATIGLLNKRNNVSVDLEMKPGETREEGPVTIALAACERTAPWEMPQETGAFVQVDVLERGQSDRSRVFSGWLFKRSPSLNVVEHPVYDVWVKDCAMRFPGDEAASGG